MGFADEIRKAREIVAERETKFVRLMTDAVFDSIRDGSPFTGAPGQPVDDGDLYDSWSKGFDNEENPRVGIVSSDAPHANAVEQGVNPHGPVTFHHGGGPGSVAATVHAAPRLVDAVLVQVVSAVPDA